MIAEFATIVGLLSTFSSGRQSDRLLTIAEFLQWLTEHNHLEVRELIERNQSTSISIGTLLKSGVEDISKMLNGISEQIAVLSTRSVGVEQLALAFAKESISSQAIEILTVMEENKTEFFLISQEMASGAQRLVLAPGPNYLCKESRFFKDDLTLMLSLGLLIQDFNSSGKPMYYITRAASKLVASLK